MRAICRHGVDWWRDCLKCRETGRMERAAAEHRWHALDDWFYQRTMAIGVATGSPLAVGAGQTGRTLEVTGWKSDLHASAEMSDTERTD